MLKPEDKSMDRRDANGKLLLLFIEVGIFKEISKNKPKRRDTFVEEGKSSAGLESNVAGVLCYLLGWITGLIFYFVSKEDKFVRFHAMQSILFSGALTVFYILVSIIQSILISIAWTTAGGGFALAISGVIGIIMTLVALASLVIWVILMVKAYQHQTFKLPITGNIAEKQFM